MEGLNDFLEERYSSPENPNYSVLKYFDAVLSTGEVLYNDSNDQLIVDQIQPTETFNVTLYYDDKTLCMYW